jgi:pimeloyl-ACP methyl ester carboxylesterase
MWRLMPTYRRGEATIHFDERGDGFPLLALAPGGMRSTIDFWQHAALNPWVSYTDDFRVIVMDQRNAGSSTGDLDAADPWGMYADDQLGLLDHLGIDRFAVLGCCIGGSFILKLVEKAAPRMAAAVLEQPIGLQDSNRELFAGLQSSWADEVAGARPDLDRADIDAFLAAMWSRDFVVSVEPVVIEACQVPLLVLPGIDDFHPTETGRRIAQMAPRAETIEPWKDSPERIAAATDQVLSWLLGTTS